VRLVNVYVVTREGRPVSAWARIRNARRAQRKLPGATIWKHRARGLVSWWEEIT